jgi:hypothetical protein
MTRKEVAALLREQTGAQQTIRTEKSMEHRALRVLRGWTTDPLYSTTDGRPLDLPIGGEGRTFVSLVRSYGGDVTTIAVLRELERLDVVTRSRLGKLRAKVRKVRTCLRSVSRFKDFSRLLADFSGTAGQLIAQNNPPLYFGFKEMNVSTASQAENFKRSFGRRASLLLDGVEHWQTRQIGKRGNLRVESKAPVQRVGVGVYVVQKQTRSTEAHSRRKR